ncbi:MAG: fibronectin type III domain-containing protein [Planctomycetota bacterium]|nr:MAG: fibronectin type III domain-containing protein [Planctomycetota bacterium]
MGSRDGSTIDTTHYRAVFGVLMLLRRLALLFAPLFLMVLSAGMAQLASAEGEAMHLHLLGAGPRHTAVVVTIAVDGDDLRAAAVSEPYRPGYRRGSVAGNIQVDAVAIDELSWDGSRLQGRIAHGEAFSLKLDVQHDQHSLRGSYEWQDQRGDEPHQASGEVRGMLVPLPRWDSADRLTLYLHNPVPGSPDGGRRDRDMRAIASISLVDGQPQQAVLVDSIVHGASRHSRQSIPVAMAGGWVGWQAVADESSLAARSVTGQLEQGEGSLRLEASHNGEDFAYDITLKRVGDVLYGHYAFDGVDGHEQQFVAGYWGSSDHLHYPIKTSDDAPRGHKEVQTHLRWLGTVNAYGGGLFGNDFGLSRVRNTGSKDYNDTPFVGGFGGVAARAIIATADDPLLRAHAQMMAQRAGQYILTHRVGPYYLMPTYKTMFRPQYWMGRGLIDLAVISESEFWKARAAEVGYALQQTQDEHGSWSYVDAGSGETGTTLSRSDRSWDHVPRANGMWLELLARLRQELGIHDYQEVENKAAAWQRQALMEDITHKGRTYLLEGRSHRSRPDDDGPTFYALYQLRHADDWDDDLFAKTMEWAEMLLYEGDDRLLRAQYHQTRRGPPGDQTIGTARMALIYAVAAEKTGKADYLQRAGILLHTLLSTYRPQSGLLWDHSVWDDPRVENWSGHAYAVLTAEVASNMIDLMAVAQRLEAAGTPIPLPQSITFPEIENQPAEAQRLNPGAKSDSGLTVRYEVDSGPATVDGQYLVLSGETGIVWVTAYQDGSEGFIPALSVERTFAVGDAAPPAPTGIQTWPVNNRAVRVLWEASAGENIIAYSVEHSRDNGETWESSPRLDEDARYHEVHGMSNGEERLFRVIAHNPSFASQPSEAVAGTAHHQDFRQDIDFHQIEHGEHWDFRTDQEEAPDGTMFVALDNKMRGDPEPAYSFWFTVEIDEPGRYDVHYFCWGNAGNNDSAWIRTDAQDQWTWIPIGNQHWTWQQRGVVLDRPGTHTIYFGARQAGNDGPRIGRIVVTNTPDRDD